MKQEEKVIPVVADEFYKDSYVGIGYDIFESQYALDRYPEHQEAILKAIEVVKPAKNVIKLTYRAFPSNNKMIEILLNKRETIYKNLNLDKIVGKGSDIIKAWVLYDYISLGLFYNMATMEEVVTKIKGVEKISETYEESFKKQNLFAKLYKLAKTEEEKLKIATMWEKLGRKISNIETDYYKKETQADNRTYLRQLYSALIRGKGVCAEFSYVYQFLLEGIGIKSIYTIIYAEGSKFAHAINLVEFKKDNKKAYYIVDLTAGSSYAKSCEGSYFNYHGFAVPKDKYFALEDNTQKICAAGYFNGLDIDLNKKIVKFSSRESTMEILRRKIVNTFDFQKEYEKAARFSLSSYSEFGTGKTKEPQKEYKQQEIL